MKMRAFGIHVFAGFLVLMLLTGCGGQQERRDNSAEVLARIEAGSTPLTPLPTAPGTPAPLSETEAEALPTVSPTPFMEHPSLTAEQWMKMLEKLDQQMKQMIFEGDRFTILQQGDAIVDEHWYVSYQVMVQKENYPVNTESLDYFVDMETEEIYLRVGEKFYSQNTVSACVDKMKGILTKDEQTRILCEFDGKKQYSGEEYYGMHAYTCSPLMEEGNGFSYTYGWYYIQKDTMEVYKWNPADDSLSKC